MLSTVVVFVITEMFGRFYLGLGDIPVYIADPDFEYVYAPYQDVYRFGNRVTTNKYGMRSAPLRATDRIRVVKMGDSVINGGPHVDQDDLSSTILEQAMQSEFGTDVRVLNVSAGSWGPDNAFAFIEKYGDFDASMFVLVFSSHDLNDNRHFQPVVGVHPAWPSKKPALAVTDGFCRYVWPKVKTWFGSEEPEYKYLQGIDDSGINSGWNDFFDYCTGSDIELLVYLHPEQDEVIAGEYNDKGKQLITMFQERNVNYILGLSYANASTDYRDHIHINATGHRHLADALTQSIQLHMEQQLLN